MYFILANFDLEVEKKLQKPQANFKHLNQNYICINWISEIFAVF